VLCTLVILLTKFGIDGSFGVLGFAFSAFAVASDPTAGGLEVLGTGVFPCCASLRSSPPAERLWKKTMPSRNADSMINASHPAGFTPSNVSPIKSRLTAPFPPSETRTRCTGAAQALAVAW
jgi:hypothetical protein